MNEQSIPWALIPGVVGFIVAFSVQFRLKKHIDRDKVLALQDLAELYPNGLPPRAILDQRGRELYLWFYCGLAVFFLSLVLTAAPHFMAAK